MREREAYSEIEKRTYSEFVSTGLVRACLVASIGQICLEFEAQHFGPVFVFRSSKLSSLDPVQQHKSPSLSVTFKNVGERGRENIDYQRHNLFSSF